MKNNISIAERNRIVEQNLSCIDEVLKSHRKMIRRAHLDFDDLYQDLAIRLICAVGNCDPENGDLGQTIRCELREELFAHLRAKGTSSDNIIYLDDVRGGQNVRLPVAV